MTACINHREIMALATCQVCQRPLCAACIRQEGAAVFCATDYHARAQERVPIETYVGTGQPLPSQVPQDTKIAPAEPARPRSGFLFQQRDPANPPSPPPRLELDRFGIIAVVCAVAGVWFGQELVKLNGRSMNVTPFWMLLLLLLIAITGVISSWLAIRNSRNGTAHLISIASLLVSILVIFGGMLAFSIFVSMGGYHFG